MQREAQKRARLVTHVTVGAMRARSRGQRGCFPSHVFSRQLPRWCLLLLFFPLVLLPFLHRLMNNLGLRLVAR